MTGVKVTRLREWAINFRVDDRYYFLKPGVGEDATTELWLKGSPNVLIREEYGYFFPMSYIRYTHPKRTLSYIDTEFFMNTLIKEKLWLV